MSKKLNFILLFVFGLTTSSYSCLQGIEQLSQNQINETVASVALETYDLLNQNCSYIGSDTDSTFFVNHPKWEAKFMETLAFVEGRKVVTFVPSLIYKGNDIEELGDDLDAMLQNKGHIIDCTIAGSIVKVQCLRKLLGRRMFAEYADWHLTELLPSLEISSDQLMNELPNAILNSITGNPKTPIGAFKYIPNTASYLHYKPLGLSAGFNAFCTGSNAYVSFGEIYKSGPLSKEEVRTDLYEAFYSDSEIDPQKAKEFKKVQKLNKNGAKKAQFFKELDVAEQKYRYFYQIFDEELIHQVRCWGRTDQD